MSVWAQLVSPDQYMILELVQKQATKRVVKNVDFENTKSKAVI
jgi:hypothetical protein